MTIDSAIPGRWQQFDGESEQGFWQFKDRVYPVPQAGTLAGATVSMQEGDTLPDDSTYEIISAKIDMVRPLTGEVKHKGGRAAVLRGMKEKYLTAKSGSGAWNELYNSRRVLDSDPQTIRYEIRFSAAISDGPTRPSPGDTYATINGGVSGFPTTGVDREPVAVHVGEVTNATILKRHVVVIFQSYHARGVTGSPGTEINPRQLVQIGRNAHKGRRRFSVPVASAISLKSSLYGSVFPTMSGKYAPKCHRVEVLDEPPNMPGRSVVIANYETPRIVGEGQLRIISGNTQSPATRDLNKKLMFGPEEYKAGTSTWWGERRITKGSAVLLEPMTTIILETAARTFQVNRIMDRQNMVNKYRLPNFGGAQPGTLLFLGSIPATTFEIGADLWAVDLAFKYSGNPTHFPKWNDRTESQLGSYVPFRLNEIGEDQAVIVGAKKTVLMWVPRRLSKAGKLLAAESPKDKHKRHPIADFRDLGKDLIITGILNQRGR